MTQVLDPMLDTQSRFSTSVISKFEDNMELQHVSINNITLCFGQLDGNVNTALLLTTLHVLSELQQH